jgi:ribonuclease BN (tRNA processing enzyme)
MMSAWPRSRLLLSLCLLLQAAAAVAAQSTTQQWTFVTLGTMAGPVANARRSQPANLLHNADQAILIDVGDGAAEQLAKVGVPLARIHDVLLSHLHFDHTGGLFALLGMRFQVAYPGNLTIYGPPGTRRLVDGLIAAMQPAAEAGAGFPGQARRVPANGIQVVELTDGSQWMIGNVKVSAATNSHYSFVAGSDDDAHYQSLSFRFELPGRSIVYTGDTGPSTNVEKLARGADILFSEVIDPEAAMADLQRVNPSAPPALLAMVRQHFIEQHLTADNVGLLAAVAGVKQLVLTHNGLGEGPTDRAIAAIAAHFKGSIVVAKDLDSF